MSSNDNVDGTRPRFFTGRQVTTLLVALMATIVLLPGAVWAVDAFSNVAVQDPVTGVKARVDSGRRLTVSDGSGVMTVDGTVNARPAAPADFVSYYGSAYIDGTCWVLAAPPTGKAVVLLTAHVDVFDNPSPGANDSFRVAKGTTCAGATVAYVTPPGLGHTALALDPGVVSTTGFSVYVDGEPRADITATGYLVPSAGLPASKEAPAEPAPRR